MATSFRTGIRFLAICFVFCFLVVIISFFLETRTSCTGYFMYADTVMITIFGGVLRLITIKRGGAGDVSNSQKNHWSMKRYLGKARGRSTEAYYKSMEQWLKFFATIAFGFLALLPIGIGYWILPHYCVAKHDDVSKEQSAPPAVNSTAS
jgi:hypothetical protein